MRSKPILLSILFSALLFTLFSININPEPQPLYKVTFKTLNDETKRQITCLAENIYFEAGNEPNTGKMAVAFVTLNRVKSGNYADSICGVVHQKSGGTCQFSWLCDKKFTSRRLTIKETDLYNDIREMATHIVFNFDKLEDVTSGATYYHADYVSPGWKLNKVEKIGRHIFYKRKGDEIDRNKEFF